MGTGLPHVRKLGTLTKIPEPGSKARRRLVHRIKRNPRRYVNKRIREMDLTDADKLLKSLAKTNGLSPEEQRELRQTLFNVDLRYIEQGR